jgi:hypothetical protein
MERYRSGHNEAVLKTVCPQGRVGSNPTLSVMINILETPNYRGFKDYFFWKISLYLFTLFIATLFIATLFIQL